MVNGILLIDKDQGMTSSDVVVQLKKLYGTPKVGHTGTLDPLATGLLVCLVGSATKLSGYIMATDKVYSGTIRLGESSTTDDAAGEITPDNRVALPLDFARAAEVLAARKTQIPPKYASIKVQGKKLYEYARRGEAVAREPRPIEIYRLEFTNPRQTARGIVEVDFVAAVSKGTYIRALARDLGTYFGSGGLITALRREASGAFLVRDAVKLSAVTAETPLLPLTAAFSELREVTPEQANDVRHGRRIKLTDAPERIALTRNGKLIAVYRRFADDVYRAERVWN